MAKDTSVGETCFDNYFTEETFDAAMIQQTQINKKQIDNDDSSLDDHPETDFQDSKSSENVNIEETAVTTVTVTEDSMEIDEIFSEKNVSKNETSIRSIADIDNIPIQDEPKTNDASSNENVVNISDRGDDMPPEEPNKDITVANNSVENIILEDDTSSASNANLKATNVVVFSPKNNFGDQQILKSDIFKGQKVFLLNGNVISKEEVEKTKPDNINIICVSNNLNDIIKNIQGDVIKPGKSLLTTNDIDKLNIVKTVDASNIQNGIPLKTNGPKFIQITQNNLKAISPKISVNVTSNLPKTVVTKQMQPVKKNFEILRSKLLENGHSDTNQNQINKSVVVTVKNRNSVSEKKDDEESAAVSKARSEFIKCRKQLIEAAIHPPLPKYRPPKDYVGQLFACEECDDAFSCVDSLKNHKNRRSVLFTYACPLCKCTLEFYNRCTFLLHVRSHDAAVKACYLTISTIPADKLNFKLKETENASSDEPRTRDRVINRKESEDDSVVRNENKENGIEKLKTGVKSINKNSLLKDFDFIKSLKKSKFSNYQTVETRQKATGESESVAESISDDSSNEDTCNDRLPDNSSASETPTVNGDSNTSQLKYYLTQTKPKLKRPSEDSQNEDESKKSKPNDNVQKVEKREPAKMKSQTPVIIRTKPSAVKTDDKNAEEIILASSDDDADAGDWNEDSGGICRECQADVTSLNKHYRGENKPLKEYPCEQCKFFNPTSCALKAHNRMHTKTPPFICPDCGFFFSTWDSFQNHMRKVCYYDYKTIRFKCPECDLLKPSVPQFFEHLKRIHTKDVYKCSLCITSSYSPKVVQIHMKKKHPGETGTVLEGYRCLLCPHILVSKKSISTHINKHVFSLKFLRYVYLCKCCKKYASGRISKFAEHLLVCEEKKRDVVLKIKEKSPNKMLPKNQRSTKINRNSKTPIKEVMEVIEKDPLSVEDWEADKLKAEFVPKAKICVMCRSADIDGKSSSLFCNACVRFVNAEDNSGDNSSSAEVKPDTGRPKRKFKCKLCKQFMNKDWSTITQHYEKDHHADFNVKGEAKGRQTKDSDNKKSETSTPVNIIKKRRISAKEAKEQTPKVSKIESSTAYKCVKCEITTNDRDEFRAHIVIHKESNTKQCFECGECFMVNSSLAKHLVIKHEIRNLQKYYIENGLLEGEEPVKNEITLSENQCDVCYLQCDSKQSYDKHIRTHGMAFVAMQSRSKDEKNPRG